MSLITYPLNNVMYSAEDAELFHATRTSGVFAENSFEISVNGSDNSVTIGPGIGWIKNGDFSGKVVALKESVTVDLGLPDSVYPRIDAVVVQFDSVNNETNIVVKKGTASSSPIAPEVVQNENVYELHLLHARRNVSALVLSFGDITDLRLDPVYCGLMADSVTKIDTSAINEQVRELIDELRVEIDGVQDGSGFWLKSDIIPMENGGTGADNEVDARRNLGMVEKIWSGSWSSGNITIPDWRKYDLFTVTIEGAASPILIIRLGSHLRGIGGNITESGAWTMTASFNINSDDTWKYGFAGYLGHTGGSGHTALVNNSAVTGVWGVL